MRSDIINIYFVSAYSYRCTIQNISRLNSTLDQIWRHPSLISMLWAWPTSIHYLWTDRKLHMPMKLFYCKKIYIRIGRYTPFWQRSFTLISKYLTYSSSRTLIELLEYQIYKRDKMHEFSIDFIIYFYLLFIIIIKKTKLSTDFAFSI